MNIKPEPQLLRIITASYINKPGDKLLKVTLYSDGTTECNILYKNGLEATGWPTYDEVIDRWPDVRFNLTQDELNQINKAKFNQTQDGENI